jgi:hypothetical protein
LDKGDGVIAFAQGKLLAGKADKSGTSVTFTTPADAEEVYLLYDNAGEGNFALEMERLNGVKSVTAGDVSLPLEFAVGEREQGLQLSNSAAPADGPWTNVSISKNSEPAPDALLTWYRFTFQLPAPAAGLWFPWQLHLQARGNGFIYVNGHALGRYWQAGPQHDFFLPDSWLNFGPGQTNTVALSLRSVSKPVGLESVAVQPIGQFAEKR